MKLLTKIVGAIILAICLASIIIATVAAIGAAADPYLSDSEVTGVASVALSVWIGAMIVAFFVLDRLNAMVSRDKGNSQ